NCQYCSANIITLLGRYPKSDQLWKLMNKVDALKALVSTGQITFEQTLQSWKKMDSEWVKQLKRELFLLYEFEEKKKRLLKSKRMVLSLCERETARLVG
ncbi:hypothetical protein FRX31_021301, partial [Thalictrum thalictroides]